MTTLYFHSLPVELEHKILQYANIECVFDKFVYSIDERRAHIWKGHHKVLKKIAKTNGFKRKGTKYIIDKLFSSKCDIDLNDDLIPLIVIRNILIQWEQLPLGDARFRCINHALSAMSKYIAFIKSHEKLHKTYMNKLDYFETQGVDVKKYKTFAV